MQHYDLIVIGTGPAGEKAAVKAAYFGKKVAVIEMASLFGGAGVCTGTLPSKTLKETALFISGKYEKGLYSVERTLTRSATIDDFLFRKNAVCSSFAEEVKKNIYQHGVDVYTGVASFEDPHTLQVGEVKISADFILIATGSYPYHPSHIPFDGKRIVDSDTILEIKEFPKSICIVGGGVISCEYATIFATMGATVFLIHDHEKILSHIDLEVAQELTHLMQESGIQFHFQTTVQKVIAQENVVITLSNGQEIRSDLFLYATGRSGHIRSLNLDKVGVKVGKRETIEVDAQYRTSVPHIFAAGDVIGFPALASTSMDQGRVAVAHMFQTEDLETLSSIVPYGIYTIPEISTVGISEDEAHQKKINYCTGKAYYKNLARGVILGANSGFLKLIFDRSSLTILGVHIIGHIATELIHYGITLIRNKRTLYNLIEEVFNYPTLHDLYKYAAYDGLGNLSGHKIKK